MEHQLRHILVVDLLLDGWLKTSVLLDEISSEVSDEVGVAGRPHFYGLEVGVRAYYLKVDTFLDLSLGQGVTDLQSGQVTAWLEDSGRLVYQQVGSVRVNSIGFDSWEDIHN